MSTVCAPNFSAILIPSPWEPSWLVVTKPLSSGLSWLTMSKLAPKPPVAKTTALDLMVFSWPSTVTLTPETAPFSSVISVTSELTKVGILRSVTLA